MLTLPDGTTYSPSLVFPQFCPLDTGNCQPTLFPKYPDSTVPAEPEPEVCVRVELVSTVMFKVPAKVAPYLFRTLR